MRTARRLGTSGLTVGPVAFGCWRYTHTSLSEAQRVLEAALEAGLDLVDTADVYGLDWGGSGFGANEELLGRVLAVAPRLRDQFVLATKGGIMPPIPYDSSPASLRVACEASLRRLQTEVIDLYQVHRPDVFAHPGDVAETLLALRAEGKIRAIGVSNHNAAQHAALVHHLGEPLASSQPEFSAANMTPMRDGVLDHCMTHGTAVLAWSPLGGGSIVSGEGVRAELLTCLDRIAERHETSRASVALAFVLAHPSKPTIIVGSQKPDRLRSAARAASLALSRSECYAIVQASEGVPLP